MQVALVLLVITLTTTAATTTNNNDNSLIAFFENRVIKCFTAHNNHNDYDDEYSSYCYK